MYYFAYGTTQHGFPHHREALGEPLGRFRIDAHAIAVPREPACSNPGCSLLHRMAVLIPYDGHATGDIFTIDDALLRALDALELSGPYTRTTVAIGDLTAFAYIATDPGFWTNLITTGRADVVTEYPRELATVATPKPCCERDPGHPPPHDVLTPS